jgi:hypothetical protein
MPDRVVVFVDYQNVYRRARGAFLLESGSPQLGQSIHSGSASSS